MKTAAAILLTAIVPFPTAAENPATLYKQNCAACHHENGQGAAGGTFPPLANSEWLKGSPARAIQIVLHGMAGPITVNGKDYNLAMPPHGESLTDQQIASILTHARTSFGNKEKPVTTKQVLSQRKQSAKRDTPWTAEELLKIHPIPSPPSPIKNLIAHTYKGDWNTLPDFAKQTATAVEEEQSNLISLRHHRTQNKFGIVWNGDLTVPKTGKFTFNLDSDDGSRILIDKKEILRINNTGPMGRNKKATIHLTKGTHPIQVEYFEKTGDKGLSITWSGPGIKGQQKLTQSPRKKKGKPYPTIDLTPQGSETVIYNNFIAGTTPRALGIGYPHLQNIAYSTQHCAPELIWLGRFIDAGLHWTGRGIGSQKPMATDIAPLTSQPPYTLTDSPQTDPRFQGYILDDTRNPTFRFAIGSTKFTDHFEPSDTSLTRTLTIHSPTNQTLNLKLHNGQTNLSITNSLNQPITQTQTHLTAPITKGKNILTITYSWK